MKIFSDKKEIMVQENNLERMLLSYTLSDVKSLVPRINFKKIKLSGFQNLYKQFTATKLIKVSLDDAIFPSAIPRRKTSTLNYEETSVNPLRRKIDKDDIPTLPQSSEEPDITFNLESQIIQEEESVIISPEVITPEATKENIVSSSSEGESFVWPPKPENKKKAESHEVTTEKKKEIKEKNKTKKKPYFLKENLAKKEDPLSEEEPLEEAPKTENKFPWGIKEHKYEGLESIFSGGLESELTDELAELAEKPETKELVTEKDKPLPELEVMDKEETIKPILELPYVSQNLEPQANKISNTPVLKAIMPNVPDPQIPDMFSEKLNIKEMKSSTFWGEINKVDLGLGNIRGANKMFQNSGGSKLTPVRIVIAGGVAATIGYLFWTYALPNLFKGNKDYPDDEKVVVRDFFTKKEKALNAQKDEKRFTESNGKKVSEKEIFKPITDKEREALILKARESIETRSDPFGQDLILQPVIEQKAKEEAKEQPLPEIPLQRKQVELVGIVSVENKNLALVNVYVADYSVKVDDDKLTRETKLKAVLSMAVPNRTEISVLDPLEDWYVKQISKSKSRSDDPTIELVKGDKKFTLRVGQRVLFPEEKLFEQIKQEFIAKQAVLNATQTPEQTPSPL